MALVTTISRVSAKGVDFSTTKVIGLEQTMAVLREFGERATRELAGALYRQGKAILAESKPEVPVDTATLRSSGHVALPVISGASVVVELGYGGPAIPYALRQHEDLMLHHTVGKPKFLEDPFRRHAATLDADMAADLRSRLVAA
jgi:hypothetical protein